jgi:hypothetical protein
MDKAQTQKKPGWLRDQMPKVAGMVDARRKEWGAEHVNACIAAAQAGKPNHFYAFERGVIIGTAFTPDAAAVPDEDLLRIAMLAGGVFMVMREPEVKHGQN